MHERIETNPDVMGGKPVIRETRVPVEIVLSKLGAAMTPESNHRRPSARDGGGHRRRTGFRGDYLADELLVYG